VRRTGGHQQGVLVAVYRENLMTVDTMRITRWPASVVDPIYTTPGTATEDGLQGSDSEDGAFLSPASLMGPPFGQCDGTTCPWMSASAR